MVSQLETLFSAGVIIPGPLVAKSIAQNAAYALLEDADGEYYVQHKPTGGLVKPVVKGIVYIAGPMRGYPKYNFPAFDIAKQKMIDAGFFVFSPADLDRELGVTEDTPAEDIPKDFLRRALERDLAAITKSTHVVLLEGWEASRGVRPEAVLAYELGLTFLFGPDPEAKVPGENVIAVVGGRLVSLYYNAMGGCASGQCGHN